jgi:hypothetical protein
MYPTVELGWCEGLAEGAECQRAGYLVQGSLKLDVKDKAKE